MSERFLAWEPEIKSYCDDNGLDFEKMSHMPMSSNHEYLSIQHFDPEKGKRGLMEDDIPMPSVLRVLKKPSGLEFEQTEYTKQYLSFNNNQAPLRTTASPSNCTK